MKGWVNHKGEKKKCELEKNKDYWQMGIVEVEMQSVDSTRDKIESFK
jgi:hypothetical protein